MKQKNSNPQKQKIKKFKVKFHFNLKKFFVWLLIVFLASSFLISLTSPLPEEEMSLSMVLSDIKEEKIEKVLISGETLEVTYKDETQKISRKEPNQSFTEILKDAGIEQEKVNFEVKNELVSKFWGRAFEVLLYFILPIAFFLFIFRKARGAQDSIFSFGRSRAKLFVKGKQSVTFKDVGGVEEEKKELEEIVDFLKHPRKYRRMGARTPKGVLLIGPSGTGKCITSNNWIPTTRGLIRISDVPKYFPVSQNGKLFGAKVLSVEPLVAKARLLSASHWYDLGEEKTVKIELRSHHSLEGTKEHPILTIDKNGDFVFKRLGEIKINDWAVLRVGDEVFGNWEKLSEEDAYILGLLIGDGGLSIRDRIYFSNSEPQLVKAFCDYFKEKFSYFPKKASSKYEWVVYGREIKQKVLDFFGLSEARAGNKNIPETVLLASKKIVVAFLQGLFDTDASITKRQGTVEFSTTSWRLAKETSAFLLNLGIYHRFAKKGLNQHATVYRISFGGQALRVFAKEVGFRLERKRQRLERYINTHEVNTNIRVFPYQGGRIKAVWQYLKEEGISPSTKVSCTFHKNLCRYANNQRGPSLRSLQEFVKVAGSLSNPVHNLEEFEFLNQLSSGRFVFDQVKKKFFRKARVYDFTVPGTHCFVAGGFINHNTLLAKAIAGEANVPFFSMAGSEFMEMLVGVGASRTRDLFSTAKKTAPSIIFIDELDAIGRMRGLGYASGSHGEQEQTLNQILTEMDGFTPNDNVVVLSATNRPDYLDPALTRPGRFDRRVVLNLPDIEERKKILKIHRVGKPFVKEVSWDKVAKRTVGFSGADLENMLNEAAILAASDNKKVINMDDIEEAATKLKLGSQKKRLQSKEERQMTAFHEAGHAVAAFNLKTMDPVHRVSIVSRGLALGYTLIPPERDKYNETRTELVEKIVALLGGRAAEDIKFSEFTGGAASDISEATRIARRMVAQYGMSNLGPVHLGPQVDKAEWGGAFIKPSELSDKMKAAVDKEVKKIVDTSYERAKEILSKNRKKLDKVVKELLKKETIEGEEFRELMGQKQK